MRGQRVFLDANVIIEAFRIGVWTEFSQAWCLETVEKCEEEALTGDSSRAGRVSVDPKLLRAGFNVVHAVSRSERNKLFAAHPDCATMDAGEKDLFAHLYSLVQPLSTLIVVSTADKGAIVRAKDVAWLDRLISLEELLSKTGASKSKVADLGQQYTSAFLGLVRTQVLMGVIP
jgi:hypothetical protein